MSSRENAVELGERVPPCSSSLFIGCRERTQQPASMLDAQRQPIEIAQANFLREAILCYPGGSM